MRLLGSRLFGVLAITAGLLTPLAAGQTDPGDVSPITFDQASFAASDSKQPIFRHQEIQLFYFSTATNIQVTEVVLYNGSTVVSSAKPPAVTTPIALVATARDDLHRGIRRAEAKEGDYGLAGMYCDTFIFSHCVVYIQRHSERLHRPGSHFLQLYITIEQLPRYGTELSGGMEESRGWHIWLHI